jgi:dTDP-4-dehydrorhamnose 3,5-epimerase
VKAESIEIARIREHHVLTGRGEEEPGRIEGALVRRLTLHADDRGHVAEILRISDPICGDFTVRQSNLTLTRAGVIKAFHYHLHQDDIFCPLAGTARIAMVDFRKGSSTFGWANTVFAGERYPRVVRIPAGVAHGYEVLPGPDLLLVYFTSREYDPADEFRVPHDDDRVGYADWGIRHR